MSTDEDSERLSPAEKRLEQHLALLRGTPAVPTGLTSNVIRSARWQRAVRAPLLALAQLTGAALDAVRLFLGGRSS